MDNCSGERAFRKPSSERRSIPSCSLTKLKLVSTNELTLSKKEQTRLMVLNGIEIGRVAAKEAAEILALLLRHVRRVLTAYRKEDSAALAHDNQWRIITTLLGFILCRSCFRNI